MKKILTVFLVLLALAVAWAGYRIYRDVFWANTVSGGESVFMNIPTGSDFADVTEILLQQGVLKDVKSFAWVAKRMHYTDRVLPGRYEIRNGMNNKELVSLLRSGKQSPVKLVLHSIRLRQDLAARVAASIEADSGSIMDVLNDEVFLNQMGFDTGNCMAIIIPNTYEFYWNTSAEMFMRRMEKEYRIFWNPTRRAKARESGLSRHQVSVLASIVEQETRQPDEKPLIAGVYMNRFRKGWKLEADPTLVFALGNFSVRRVLSKYKNIDSPYNTYKNEGLPPGPICIPSISSIDAVLDYADHSYMYFCAKHDFSGYHVFSTTYAEHLAHARRFQRELNKRHINS